MKSLVYLAPVPLQSPSQRPHHFVQWAHARLGCEVIWVEPYPVRLPRWSDVHRLGRAARNGRQVQEPGWRDASWLNVLTPKSLPLEPLPGGAWIVGRMQHQLRAKLLALLQEEDTWLVVGRPSGLASSLSSARRGERTLYDVMDDMPQFHQGLSRRWVARAHAQLLAQAQVVWGSSESLIQAVDGRTQQPAVLVRNGTVLPPAKTNGEEAAHGLGSIEHARAPLVLGYVGTIASWFDWEVVRRLARILPQAQLHIHGPSECPPPADLPDNVHPFGPVPHAEVFGLLRGWHAGLIPFLHNALTQSVDPVKYYEYRACGLPVLTTMFGEMPHHARSDPGVWALESLASADSGELEQRLRAWHEDLAQMHAQGLPLEPDNVRRASWGARFEAGADACGWLGDASKLP